jgi:chorismate mutase
MNNKFFTRLVVTVAVCMLAFTFSYAQSVTADPQVNTKHDLDANRVKIDSLDNQLMLVLGQRERIVKAIGIYKAKNHIPPLQAARFKQVLEKAIAAGSREGLSAEFITEMMNAIHKESLRIEGEIAGK